MTDSDPVHTDLDLADDLACHDRLSMTVAQPGLHCALLLLLVLGQTLV